jgi:acyl-CoA thioesterase
MSSLSKLGTPYQRWLGIRWCDVAENGTVEVEIALRDDLRGPTGALEGGVVATLADVAGASAAAAAASRLVATQHVAISFLAPGREGPIRATGIPIRVGKRDAVSEVRIVDLGNEARLIAVALVTLRIFDTPLAPRP